MLFEKVEKMYRDMLYQRQDDNGSVFFFSAADFPGLHQEEFLFSSCRGHQLAGAFYYYDHYIPHRLVIFDHGMGVGHRSYMKEIELLARQGYLVFSYDHTGCRNSGGETTGGFVQSLIDLNDAVTALRQDERYKDLSLSVIGHSWGAFSTMNISALHPDIQHIIGISGFTSVERILRQFFSGPLSFFFRRIYAKECAANPEYIHYDAVESLQHTDANVLLIYSEDDPTVRYKSHALPLQKALAHKDNVRIITVRGKAHNPNYTKAAVKYKDNFFRLYQKALKKNELQTKQQKEEFISHFDWNQMTEQDPAIWDMILEVLEQ